MPDLSDKVSDMQRFNELPQEVRDEIAVLLAAIGDPNATDEDANINGIINYAQSVVALRTRPPASSMEGWRQPEPVAWRYRFDVEAEEGLDWEYRAERPAFTPFGEEYVTVEPLYAAAPSQPPSAEGWRTMDSAPTANHPEDLVARPPLASTLVRMEGVIQALSNDRPYAASVVADALAKITSLVRERDALLLQAQSHAMEARGANDTIYKIYQVLSGGKGEPGNWNGAEPARAYVAAAESTIRNRDETIAAQAAALDAFDQLLDDMGDDGLCVCQAAKDQAIAAVRALASPHQEGTGT